MVSYSMMEGAEHGLGDVTGSKKITEDDRRYLKKLQREVERAFEELNK